MQIFPTMVISFKDLEVEAQEDVGSLRAAEKLFSFLFLDDSNYAGVPLLRCSILRSVCV